MNKVEGHVGSTHAAALEQLSADAAGGSGRVVGVACRHLGEEAQEGRLALTYPTNCWLLAAGCWLLTN